MGNTVLILSNEEPLRSCRVFCGMQRINRIKYGRRGWRPSGEKEAMNLREFLRTLHREQRARGGRSHHEQSTALGGPPRKSAQHVLARTAHSQNTPEPPFSSNTGRASLKAPRQDALLMATIGPTQSTQKRTMQNIASRSAIALRAARGAAVR